MTHKTVYWDSEAGEQRERDCTPDEIADIEARAAAPAPVPHSVTPRQIRQALTRAGLRTSVESAVAASPQDLKDWWEFSTEVQRMHPAVVSMGEALGVSSAALDALWVTAAGL